MPGKSYDTVIIGGGLGGLLCAVMLAKEGRKVVVLEKNRQIGGCLQTFALRKKVFDACVHYIGGLGEGHTLHRIFRYAGIMDRLPLHPLDRRGFDRIAFGDEAEMYPLATREHFTESLLPFFPKEAAAMEAYLALVSEVAGEFGLYNLRPNAPADRMGVFSLELMHSLRALTTDERLVQVLVGNNMLYGGVEGQTPFYNHAMCLDGYLHSVHKAVPGSSIIAKQLWKELQRHGGEIYRNTAVTALHEANGLIQYARTADGQQWDGTDFIAAIHPAVLLEMTDSRQLRPAYRNRVRSLTPTPPCIMINIVLKPGVIPYPASNVYWHPSGETLAQQTPAGIVWPDSQAIFYNEDTALPGFAESLSVLVYADAEDFAKWNDSENITGVHLRRSDDYHAQKEAFADRILDTTFRRFPELRDAIAAKSIATPLTLRDYTGTPFGSAYGPLKDAARPAHTALPVRTRIPNLLLTGQNVNMHGVMGVSITAVATCAELLGTGYLLERIRSA